MSASAEFSPMAADTGTASVAAGERPRGGLAGKRVVVTRAKGQADELDDLLRQRGAEPVSYPCIAIVAPRDTGPLDEALSRLSAGGFDWLVLTSRNTVSELARRLRELGLRPDRRVAVAAVGWATALAAERELGLHAEVVPDETVAEALANEVARRLVPGARVLLCQADIARPELADLLDSAGAKVTPVAAYRTKLGSGGVDLPKLLAERSVDAITFTSASTARNLLLRLVAEGSGAEALERVCLACLGPVAAGAARELGLVVDVTPPPGAYSVRTLVDALEAHYKR